MFGDENHKRAIKFCDQKSPVKVLTTWNERYNNYQVSDRSGINPCSNMEVCEFLFFFKSSVTV